MCLTVRCVLRVSQHSPELLGRWQPCSACSIRSWPRPCVGDVRGREAAAAGLEDAVAEDVEAARAVGVAADDDGDAVALGGGASHVVQIEAGRVSVDLHELSVAGGGGKNGFEVDGVRFAAADEAARGMGDDGDVWILERAEDAIGDLFARLLLAVVDAGDDPVGLGQHVVGQVHAAFFEDVALDAFEDREVVEFAVELVDFFPLGAEALGLRPLAMLTRGEWSVMAMYFRPRSIAASAISRRLALPSLAVVCMWRSPTRSVTSINLGSVPAAAQANSCRASRISGGNQGRSIAA